MNTQTQRTRKRLTSTAANPAIALRLQSDALVRRVAELGSSGQETESIAMPKMNRQQGEPHVTYHKNGSVWAKGFMLDGEMVGYWDWFRLDGARMRSGFFIGGQQSGLWTTYAADGRIVKRHPADQSPLEYPQRIRAEYPCPRLVRQPPSRKDQRHLRE